MIPARVTDMRAVLSLFRSCQRVGQRDRVQRVEGYVMKIVVIGGTGLIGSKLVAELGERGHEAVPASPNTGVNTLTGEGLAEVLEDAAVVVDVSNSPSFADDPVMEFFRTSTTNLLEYSTKAGVGHYGVFSGRKWEAQIYPLLKNTILSSD